MADTYYTSLTWTQGDYITSAKMTTMLSNDRAVDALYQGVELTERSAPSTPGATKVHFYAKDKGGIPTLYAINDAGTDYELSEGRPTFVFTITGTLATGTSKTPIIPVHRALTIVRAYAVVKTGPTGANLVIDINRGVNTIMTGTKLVITDGNTYGSQTTFSTTTLAADESLTIDIDAVGSTIPGDSLTVTLRCK